MPVEIKEMVVKATTESSLPGGQHQANREGMQEGNTSAASGVATGISYELRMNLVEQCVMEVMHQLQKKKAL